MSCIFIITMHGNSFICLISQIPNSFISCLNQNNSHIALQDYHQCAIFTYRSLVQGRCRTFNLAALKAGLNSIGKTSSATNECVVPLPRWRPTIISRTNPFYVWMSYDYIQMSMVTIKHAFIRRSFNVSLNTFHYLHDML